MNKALRKDDPAASTSVESASWSMRLARCRTITATSRTVVVDVAHVDLGIVVDYGVVEILASRRPSHIVMLRLRLCMDCDVYSMVSSTIS